MPRKLEWHEWDELSEDETHMVLQMLLDKLNIEVWERKYEGQRRTLELRDATPEQETMGSSSF